MILPAHINKRALNKACVIKWNRAKLGRLSPRLAIITPSWLSVERAIIFFISDSIIAAIPAMNMVRLAVRRRRELKNFKDERAG